MDKHQRASIKEVRSKKYKFMNYFNIFLLPALITHVVPGVVLYSWVLLGWVIALAFAMVFIRYRIKVFLNYWLNVDTEEVAPGSLADLAVRNVYVNSHALMVHVLFFLTFQSSFNMTYFYYGGDGYLGGIQNDFLYRNSACYFTRSFDSVQGVITFFSFV